MDFQPHSPAKTPTADDLDLFQLNPQATTQVTTEVIAVEPEPSSPKRMKLTDHSDSKLCKVEI